MAEVLMLNPKARKRRKVAAKRRANPRRARRSAPRRRNPLPMFGRVRRARRVTRRRRNPIGLGLSGSSIVASVKSAMIGAVGAVGVDLILARVMPMLPAAMRPVAGKVGAGDAVKLLATIMLGRVLRGPTRGLSMKMAEGALVVQAHGIVKSMLPAGLAGIDGIDGMGYWSPATVDDGTMRVGPAIEGVDEYVPGTALLSEYVDGQTPLLGEDDAFSREGVSIYR